MALANRAAERCSGGDVEEGLKDPRVLHALQEFDQADGNDASASEDGSLPTPREEEEEDEKDEEEEVDAEAEADALCVFCWARSLAAGRARWLLLPARVRAARLLRGAGRSPGPRTRRHPRALRGRP